MLKFAIILAAVAVWHVQAANRYRLFTSRNTDGVIVITPTDEFLPDELSLSNKTIVLIHGHGGSMTDDFSGMVRREILDRGDYNVIVVDWAVRAGGSYSSASSHVNGVALQLSQFLRWLSNTSPETTTTTEAPGGGETLTGSQDDETISLSEVHLVGFGLGAHIAGIASRELGIVGRITGLDPSGSGWDSRSPRLKSGDAEYVEIIHTDGSGLLANGIGSAIGDNDFFANGGSNQPGCFSHSCSHNRAYELFAASMRGHLFGNACSSMTQMNLNLCRGAREPMGGTDVNKPRRNQIYRINTSRTYPYN